MAIQQPHPLDVLPTVAPELASWWRKERERGFENESVYACLASELVERAAGRTIPLLRTLAPHIEDWVQHYDDHDQVSLGLIETLIGRAEELDLDLKSLRESLGPRARGVWNSLYLYLHQTRLVQTVSFTVRDLGQQVREPARLDSWDAEPTDQALEPLTRLARLTINGAPYHLVARCALFFQKRVAAAEADLAIGDLLAYVLPNDGLDRGPPDLVALDAAT